YDGSRVNNLKKSIPPIYEPDLSETIKDGQDKGILKFSDNIKDLNECDFIFLSYDTPVREDDSSDTAVLENAVNDVRGVMKDHSVLLVSSQSPVGFCNSLRGMLKEKNNTLDLAYSPENLRLGEAINCYLDPGRIILGTAQTDTEEKCITLFSQINADILKMNLESAEMVKHGINSFLAMSIVFANHLADICEMKGARITDVIEGMKSDPRIGKKAYLAPGIGFSGGTLGRDLQVLNNANKQGHGAARIFGYVHTQNNERKDVIIKRLEKLLGGFNGKTIGVLGLTYKPGTSTLRRSLPVEIVKQFSEKGAIVKVFDPKADYKELEFTPFFSIANNIVELAESTDALILLTEWQNFKEFNWAEIPARMRRSIFFDTKNFLDERAMSAFGFQYHSIGR
ncbi:MAG: nucleotide sugar dehydrogenase, partial [Desulfobacterales bacterium]|nr:nucleotide sugar dehydrogenase [Desulfobacterales bacterium]